LAAPERENRSMPIIETERLALRELISTDVWPPNTRSRRVAEKVHSRMREFVWEKSGTVECLYETLRADLQAH